jgi:hypothetical protein
MFPAGEYICQVFLTKVANRSTCRCFLRETRIFSLTSFEPRRAKALVFQFIFLVLTQRYWLRVPAHATLPSSARAKLASEFLPDKL